MIKEALCLSVLLGAAAAAGARADEAAPSEAIATRSPDVAVAGTGGAATPADAQPQAPTSPPAPPKIGPGTQVGAGAPQSTDSTAKPGAPVTTPGYVGPLAGVGRRLNDAGLFPIAFLGEFYVANPDFGVNTGKHQYQTQLNLGFDYNLGPMFGLKGTSIHFLEGIVPDITRQAPTNNYFTQAGDVINASASGFVPEPAHLTRFTLEQQILNNRALIEGGKGYVNDYVARPLCLNAFTCMSTIAITHKASAFNFPNYSNWFARGAYNVSSDLKLTAMWYYDDTGYSTTNGWQTYRKTYYDAYLVDAQFAQPQAAYPRSAELFFYYNRVPQVDTITGVTHDWQAGLFASAMQTIWRPDTHAPRMLQAFVSFADSFNQATTETPTVGGLNYSLDAGLTLRAPFRGRPADAYSLQLTTVQLTGDELTALRRGGYDVHGPNEFAFDASANLKLYDFVFISPYVEYIKNANAAFASNPVTNPNHLLPKDGFGVGVTFSFVAAQFLGLTTRPSGYDGHYP